MADDGYEVAVDVREAGRLTRAADQVGKARAAAAGVQLDRSAYGVVCAQFPRLLAPLEALVVMAMKDTEAALDDLAAGTRHAMNAYAASDEQVAQHIETALG